MRIRQFLATFALLLASTAFSSAQDVFYFPQIGDGQVGTIRFQTTFIFINTGADTVITLEFFGTGNGSPLSVDLGNLGMENRFEFPLMRGQSLSARTRGAGNLVVGYARITVPQGGTVGGTAVFTRTHIPTGTILYEAGVPASRDLNQFTLFVDTIGNRDTGLAMVNTERGGGSNEVQLELYDLGFRRIATTVLPLRGGAHTARFVPELFSAVPSAREMSGTLAVSSPDDLAAVTLRTNDAPGIDFPDEVPTLTTFPVVTGSAASAAGLTGTLSFSAKAGPSLTLELPILQDWPEGALLLFYRDGRLVDAEHHALPAWEREPSLQLRSQEEFDQVDVQLIFSDGGRLPTLTLRP